MSRELDRKVAERLGRTLKRDDCNSYWVDQNGEEPQLQNFSEDMNAAMELWQDDFDRLFKTRKGWVVLRAAINEGRLYSAPTPSEAICLAFLGNEKV